MLIDFVFEFIDKNIAKVGNIADTAATQNGSYAASFKKLAFWVQD